MKCINCGTDNNLKDRTANNGRCSKCGHSFVFEPTTMGTTKLTDPMFAKAIGDISVNHTLFFTQKQMFYFLDSRFRKKAYTSNNGCGCLSIFSITFISIFSYSGGGLIVLFATNLVYQIIVSLYFIQTTKPPYLNAAIRKENTKSLITTGIFTLIIGIFFSVVTNSFPFFVTVVIFGVFYIYRGSTLPNIIGKAQEFKITESAFQVWLNRWQEINGNVQKLLPAPQHKNNQTTPINPDVTAYSFDRLIVCDSAEIAQFLIANNFHFENNCAILSITGYPESIFQITMDMLRRNPELKVYALHNCTPKGLDLINQFRTSSNWFQNSNITIIDIGITPHQVIAAKKNVFMETSPQSASEASQLSSEICSNLSPEELQWLQAGNFVNLESFRPQQLIQIVQRGIANTLNLESDTGLLIASSSDTHIYTTQSFG